MAYILQIITAFALMGILAGAVAPSFSSRIDDAKATAAVTREEVIVEQVRRYWAVEGAPPADMGALIAKGYVTADTNNNGFGGTYAFTLNPTTAQITITTTIPDAAQRAKYIKNFKRIWRPTDQGSGVVQTVAILPSAGTLLAGVASVGDGTTSPASAVVSPTAPAASTTKYWYDTSSGTAQLKVSDGNAWVATATAGVGGSGSSTPATPPTGGSGQAPTNPLSGINGELYYVADAASGAVSTYIWYNGAWYLYSNAGTSTQGTPSVSGTYTPILNALKNTAYQSEAIAFNTNGTTPMAVNMTTNATGVQCSFNGAAWEPCQGKYIQGATTIQVKLTTSAQQTTTSSARITLGTGAAAISATFAVTTRLDPNAVAATTLAGYFSGSSTFAVVVRNNALYGVGSVPTGLTGISGGLSTLYDWTKLPTPEPVSAVSMPTNNFIVITTTSGKVFGAGWNSYGQLGTGGTARVTNWAQMMYAAGSGVTTALDAQCNSEQCYVLLSDGTAWGVGSNSGGGLGVGDTTSRTYLTQLKVASGPGAPASAATNIVAISVSNMTVSNAALLTSNNTVYVSPAGLSSAGNAFNLVAGPATAAKIRASSGGVFIIDTSNNLGAASYGGGSSFTYMSYPGNGSSSSTLSIVTPSRLSAATAMTDVLDVQCGGYTTYSYAPGCLAIRTDYTVYALGSRGGSMLGGNSTSTAYYWTPVLNANAEQERAQAVVVGGYASPGSFLVRTDGTIWAAGSVSGHTLGVTPVQGSGTLYYHEKVLDPLNLP